MRPVAGIENRALAVLSDLDVDIVKKKHNLLIQLVDRLLAVGINWRPFPIQAVAGA
jgi:hypothetical protein